MSRTKTYKGGKSGQDTTGNISIARKEGVNTAVSSKIGSNSAGDNRSRR